MNTKNFSKRRLIGGNVRGKKMVIRPPPIPPPPKKKKRERVS
jgi:hypothetical protein